MTWSECKLHGENRLTQDFGLCRCKRLVPFGGVCTGQHSGVTSQSGSQIRAAASALPSQNTFFSGCIAPSLAYATQSNPDARNDKMFCGSQRHAIPAIS